jgi:uncharacterized protein (TIGR02145 family)
MKDLYILLFILLLLCGCDNGGEEIIVASYGYQGEFGKFVDPRDSREYKTVVINGQEWFAEDLNYGSGVDNHLYSWEEARNVCPEGWHLPVTEEWALLFLFAGRDGDSYMDCAYKHLADVDGFSSFIGKNDLGFSAKAGYIIGSDGTKILNDDDAYYWSYEDNGGYGSYVKIGYGRVKVSNTAGSAKERRSVRCIKGGLPERYSSSAESSSSEKNMESSSSELSSSSRTPTILDSLTVETFLDERDSNEYKVVCFDKNCWMAEHLHYLNDYVIMLEKSAGEKDSSVYYYKWIGALLACPEGWRMPDTTDWRNLVNDLRKVSNAVGTNAEDTLNALGFRDVAHIHNVGGGGYAVTAYDYFWISTDTTDAEAFLAESDGWIVRYDMVDKVKGNVVRCKKNDVLSSSSLQMSSSSAVYVDPSEVERGTFTDARDGRVYRYVRIGDQTWMAENLNYKVEQSYCYDDDEENCEKYGRLYTWAVAMDSAGVFSPQGIGCGAGVQCGIKTRARGICPRGWHLPSVEEGDWLVVETDKERAYDGTALMDTLWGGKDLYGFGGLPSGRRDEDGSYRGIGEYGCFWLAAEGTNQPIPYARVFDYSDEWNGAMGLMDHKDRGTVVRCLKD